MGVVGRLDQYASMLADEFDETTANNPSITGLGTYYASEFDENTSITTLVQTGENLFERSEEIDNTYWNKANLSGTITANQTTAPDGNLTADLYQEDATTTGRYVSKGMSVTSGTSYTVSIWSKQAPGSTRYLGLILPSAGFGVNVIVSFTLSGVGSRNISVSGTATAAEIQAYPNGWYRCYLASQATATANNVGIQIRLSNSSTSGNANYVGDGTSGIYLWGAQFERSSVATDYIPTTTTSLTRSLPSPILSLSANVFPPYDLVYDEFGGTLFGAGQGRYKRQNTDKSVIVYNEIDEVSDFRDIVRTGLILDLDVSQSLSYAGTGTTWTDLSGGGNTGTLAGNTSFSSQGYFVLDGVDGTRIGTSGPSYPTTWNQAVTFEIWAYFDADGTWHNTFSGGLFSRGSTAGTLGLTRANGDNSVRMWLRDSGGTATAAGTVVRDAWYQIVGTWGGDANLNLKLYLNGVETGSFTKTSISGSPDIGGYNLGGMSSTLSGSPGNYMKGRISAARMYDRELSAAEVSQNYNALRNRFGI